MFYYCINSVFVESDVPLWGNSIDSIPCQVHVYRSSFSRQKGLDPIWTEQIEGVLLQELLIDRKTNALYYYAYTMVGDLCFKCVIEYNDIVSIKYDYFGIGATEVVYFLYKKLPLSFQYMGYTVLHGASLIYKSQNIVLLGDSGVGKTTLSMLMQINGAKLLADDYVVIKNGMLYYTNTFSHVSKDTIELLARESVDRIPYKKIYNSISGKYIMIPSVENNGVVPVGTIYLLNRSINNCLSIEKMQSSNSFCELLKRTINGMINPAIQFKELVSLCSNNTIKKLYLSANSLDIEKLLSIME